MDQTQSRLDQAQAIKPFIINLRRTIHKKPELGFDVQGTASLVARTLQELGAEVQTGVGRTEVHRAGKHQRVGIVVYRPLEGKAGGAQGDAGVHRPAGVTVQIAQRGDEAELAHAAQRAVFGEGDRGQRAAHVEREGDVVDQQAVMAAPACHRQAQSG